MGIYNSSTTRVVPVFDRLFDLDPSGRAWLSKLLGLGSHSGEKGLPEDPGLLRPDHPRWWGKNERRLAPPRALLRWLVENISLRAVEASGDRDDVLAKRRLVAQRDPWTIADALALIDGPGDGRRWYRLEGESFPDACLETDRLLVVVEGKRTERSCTSKTKWMGRRSQLLRHMDAALEVAGGRRVVGLLLVEGDEDKLGGFYPSPYWLSQSEAQTASGMLRDSLPHRTPTERVLLAEGLIGVATWQQVCSTFDLPWPPVQDVV
jgi:hypothetical protein